MFLFVSICQDLSIIVFIGHFPTFIVTICLYLSFLPWLSKKPWASTRCGSGQSQTVNDELRAWGVKPRSLGLGF